MDLYSQILLDHGKNPRHTEPLKNATHAAQEVNTSCGDKTRVQLQVKEKKIEAVSHQTEGCLVSVFSASILSGELVGKTTAEVLAMTPEDLLKLLGVELTPSRTKCALLPLMAIQKALKA